ncbi:ficolin-2-like [Asterias amurensis]|uniref:ficolin-2-like n=1 Tax=Asterias amurensis TaxID=7602 RepID=UPI003AB41A44
MALISLRIPKLVCLSMFVVNAVCQTETSIIDSAGCVCQPQLTVNHPANTGGDLNFTNVTKELKDVKTQLAKLQETVSALVGSAGDSALLPKDCSEALAMGVTESGVYAIQPLDSGRPFNVYCDMDTDGGGWTVFQRRKDGSVDFFLNFAHYSRGFGDLEGDFWLGNEFLHRLTREGVHELRVDLSDFYDNNRYAKYGLFRVSDVSDSYRLTVRSYSGNAGDSMDNQNDQQFTTKDLDNDLRPEENCARRFHGAWWYKSCHASNLNGAYLRGSGAAYGRGVTWRYWHGNEYSLKTSEMKIRSTP